MSDLLVDFETLEAGHKAATDLKREFEDLPDAVGEVEWGRSSIGDAMHTFGTNWTYHRNVLGDKIGEMAEKIESCMTTFEHADKQLYDQLTKQAAGRTGGDR